jgi:probable F420-dependent oxidoreductase
MPHIGLSTYDLTAAQFVGLARVADRVGFASLWLGEHIFLPCGYESAHPTHRGEVGGDGQADNGARIIDSDTELLDPATVLGAAAAVTGRIQLATGVYILPLRHPLLTARMCATLDAVSAGRFVLGVGSGWLREEFDALAVPFAERGLIQDENLDILRAAFVGGPFHHSGKQFHLGEVQVSASPVGVRLVLGGNSDKAMTRAVRRADAWFASGIPTFDEACRLRDRLDAVRRREGRIEPLTAYFRVPGGDVTIAEQYVAEGLDHLLFWAQNVCDPRGEALADELGRAAGVLGLS